MSLSNPALEGTLVSIPAAGTLKRAAWATALVLAGVAIIGLVAQVRISIPPSPVPITGSTLGVLLVGAAYGSRLGGATIVAYILVGVAGIPVFTEWKSGVEVLSGPTGGYIFGYLVAAFLVGKLAESKWDRSPWMTAAAMVAGNLAIYAFGVIILSRFVGWDRVWALGVGPFLIGDAFKIAVASAVLPAAWWLKDRNSTR